MKRALDAPRRPAPRAGEACEMCGTAIGDTHAHVVDTRRRALLCACRPCGLLFTNEGAGGGRMRVVPERVVAMGSVLTDALWDELAIPVGVAFFFRSSGAERVNAFYPGPAGATESTLPLETWDRIASASPELSELATDVEALLVSRAKDGTFTSYLVPIDVCYELVGRIRKTWRGFDGGEESHAAIDSFFEGLRMRSTLGGAPS